MTGDRPQSGGRTDDEQVRTPTSQASRRLVLAAGAALAPILAGAGPARAATTAPERTTPDPCGGRHALVHPATTSEADWEDVVDVLQHRGRLAGNQVYRMGFLRQDLKVTSYGYSITPALGVGSFVSFLRYEDGKTMLMGDMAVTEREMQRVIDILDAHGIAQTAIHKHLLTHDPAVWWMHIHGMHDDATYLAGALRSALGATGTPPGNGVPEKKRLDLDTAGIDRALGAQGDTEGDIYKVVFARNETVVDHDRVLPRMTGSTTAISFQPVGKRKAIVNGDFVILAHEVQHVIRALRRGGIDVVSIHSHMLTDDPRLFFLHFWGVGDGVRLARALRAAVERTNVSAAVALG
ncbi:DUF1259 domain-containing protein [Streptomyces mobaraensis]|uniref:DUF1259 domain-containing protein n=1 Tax=Streptomyces mobaraensis TaxID=35621 RepID=A0A5N5WDM8_STRMB|nr:DUF1259 domain-containing protein [Streptomyces mobaraensis]KAB7850284.1 DUF1259 domain-containing protein [Streptomyces mobaraensis]